MWSCWGHLMELELLQWGDGSIRLSYWDHMEGKDRIFVLMGDGTAREAHGEDQEGEEILTPVDLVAALRAMVLEGVSK